MDLQLILQSIPRLLAGVPVTLELVAASLLIGQVLAWAIALARLGNWPGLSHLARFYVFVLRGTPLLVQIAFVYYGIGGVEAIRETWAWVILREPFYCAVIALALNTGAYTSEMIRGGILAVGHGQIEAARACGMSPRQVFWRIVAPQAVRHALPAYGNEVVLMVKASALASTITLLDITGIAKQINSNAFAPVEVFCAAGAIYLLINTILSFMLRRLDHWLTPELRRS
jgi:octopine/nopaline transport system permease protein